jgi:protein transport protein SEC20
MVLGILGIFDPAASASSTSISISSGPSSISSSSAFTMSSGQPEKSEADRVIAGGDPSKEGSESQKVGQMAEESRKDEHKPVRLRGDGTPLVDSDAPRNPKKRMWEEPPAENKEKDEL